LTVIPVPASQRSRRIGLAPWLPLAVAVLAAAAPARAQGNLEYALKATFIYKLAAFVEWPAAAFESPASAINLCVAGTNPFGKVLDQAVAGQKIEAHPIVVRRVAAADKASRCHILYLGLASAPSAAQALRGVRGAPVLTVTDSAFEDGARGIVHFVIRDSRVRFEINSEQAAQNGIVLSSKLKSLAVPTRPNA
jgi:hypothetical protein